MNTTRLNQWRKTIPYIFGFVLIGLCMDEGINSAFASIGVKNPEIETTFKEFSLRDLLDELYRQTAIQSVYNVEDVASVVLNREDLKSISLNEVPDTFLKENGFCYSMEGNVAVIKKMTQRQAVAPVVKQVEGVVYDEDGAPLPGVSVIVKNSTIGVASDVNGKFTIKVPKDATVLVFSFVGMKTQEKVIPKNNKLSVVLKSTAEKLEEVIITSYGTVKKSAYAGSAVTVGRETLKDIPVISFKDALQGSVPGVVITSGSGQPGASTSMRIRGMGSFNASNSPLYVVDGIPVLSGDISATGSDAGLDIMSTLSNSDIATISVIKDAAAASLYGSRAANGVVLITTKRGQKGKTRFDFKSNWGFSDFAMKYRETMNGEERRETIYEGLMNKKLIGGGTEDEATAYADEEIDAYAPIPWCGFTDWRKIMFQKGSQADYELSASGGNDKMTYYSSLSYMKTEGITKKSNLERVSGRLNIDYKILPSLNLGGNVLFSSVNQSTFSEGLSYTAPFYSTINCVVPSDPVYNEDGSWNREFIRNSDRNPALAQKYNSDKDYITRFFNTIWGEYELFSGLKLKSTLSFDYTLVKGKQWDDPQTSDGDDDNGALYSETKEYQKMVWSSNISYVKTFSEHHNLDLLFGYEIDSYQRDYLSAYVKNFASAEKAQISNGQVLDAAGGSMSKNRLVSYISRLNYNYDNKYFFGASYRVDGSSKLYRDNRWGSFWSVSAAWRMGEEMALKAIEQLSDLKLRASYGVNGTLPADYYGYYGLSSITGNYIQMPAIQLSQIENKDLSWETNYNFNIGLDVGLFDRLNFTLEYYTRTTKDLLMDKPISMTTALSSYLMNIGKVKNKGVEFELRSQNMVKKNFSWTTTFNISHNKNKIVCLDGQQQEIISGSQIRRVGKPYRTFYLKEFGDINPETGNPRFYTNVKGADGKYEKELTENLGSAQYIALKCADSKVLGGFGNSLRWGIIDVNVLFAYQFGGYAYDTYAQKTEHGGKDMEANIPLYYRKRWKKPGDIVKYERFIADRTGDMGSYQNSRRLHPTDFIRLKNLSVGISMPKDWVQRMNMQQVRVYASTNNLWTWAKYDFYDPESVSGGSTNYGTPPLKNVIFGLDMTF